jgi:hypothetical protein
MFGRVRIVKPEGQAAQGDERLGARLGNGVGLKAEELLQPDATLAQVAALEPESPHGSRKL